MTAAILSRHCGLPPFGLEGGGPRKCGRNAVELADGGSGVGEPIAVKQAAELLSLARTLIMVLTLRDEEVIHEVLCGRSGTYQ